MTSGYMFLTDGCIPNAASWGTERRRQQQHVQQLPPRATTGEPKAVRQLQP